RSPDGRVSRMSRRLTDKVALVAGATRGAGRGIAVQLGAAEATVYDLAKAAVNRMAFALAHELKPYNATAVSLTPGWLRSEAMLEAYGVAESNWLDATARTLHFATSANPPLIGQAVTALAQHPYV